MFELLLFLQCLGLWLSQWRLSRSLVLFFRIIISLLHSRSVGWPITTYKSLQTLSFYRSTFLPITWRIKLRYRSSWGRKERVLIHMRLADFMGKTLRTIIPVHLFWNWDSKSTPILLLLTHSNFILGAATKDI